MVTDNASLSLPRAKGGLGNSNLQIEGGQRLSPFNHFRYTRHALDKCRPKGDGIPPQPGLRALPPREGSGRTASISVALFGVGEKDFAVKGRAAPFWLREFALG